jgi:hypothetical protein
MCIYFVPTYLYIKQHNVTGLKYFGKTTRTDPVGYTGSGLHWKRHLKVHGNDVSTIWCRLFTSQQELVGYAIQFSIENQIVESKEWANIRIENGLDGQPKGAKFGPMTPEHKKLLSEKLTGKKVSAIARKKMSDAAKGNTRHLGISHSAEAKLKMSEAMKGKVHSEETKQKMRDAHAKRRAAKAALL